MAGKLLRCFCRTLRNWANPTWLSLANKEQRAWEAVCSSSLHVARPLRTLQPYHGHAGSHLQTTRAALDFVGRTKTADFVSDGSSLYLALWPWTKHYKICSPQHSCEQNENEKEIIALNLEHQKSKYIQIFRAPRAINLGYWASQLQTNEGPYLKERRGIISEV